MRILLRPLFILLAGAALALSLAAPLTTSAAGACLDVAQPTSFCSGTWTPTTNSDDCISSWRCVVTLTVSTRVSTTSAPMSIAPISIKMETNVPAGCFAWSAICPTAYHPGGTCNQQCISDSVPATPDTQPAAPDLSQLQAQLDALTARLAALKAVAQPVPNPDNGNPSCTLLSRTLRRDSEGSDVSVLQSFLANSAGYTGSISGHFGALTEAAVQKWQREHGIVSSGTPSTTGFGVVGPQTISAMNALICPPVAPVNASAPVGFFDAIDAQGNAIGWALDRDVPTASINVAIYLDGPQGQGTLIAVVPANTSRPDVNSGQIVGGDHGFIWPIPMQYQNASHSWYIYGVDSVDQNSQTLLTGGPRTFSLQQVQTSCTPLPAQTQTAACPTGQSGSILQTRVSSCAADATTPTWSDWVETANTCTAQCQSGYVLVSGQCTPPQQGAQCVDLSANLFQGVSDATTGGDVSKLQNFLIGQNLLPSSTTLGFFGPLTESALQSWQSGNGVVTSGTPDTTGFGVVGPKTRAALACTTAPVQTAQSCTTPWGATLQSGDSVSASQAASVAPGQNCVQETRVCTNGTLSGSYTFANCTTQTQNAAFALSDRVQTTDAGVNVRGTPSTSGSPLGTQVKSALGTVVDGPSSASGYLWWKVNFDTGLDGWMAQDYLQKAGAGVGSCTLDGVTVPSGTSASFSAARTVPFGQQCSSELRTCVNGAFINGSNQFASCSVGAALSCTLDGTTVADGATKTFYSDAAIVFGLSCSTFSLDRTCTNGVLSGADSFSHSSCTVGDPNACSFNDQTVAHGAQKTAYQTASVPFGQSCSSEVRTCTNGTLSGSYQFAACTPATAPACVVLSPQTQTVACAAGQSGSITQTRTSSCAANATTPTWSDWVQTASTCTAVSTAFTTGDRVQTTKDQVNARSDAGITFSSNGTQVQFAHGTVTGGPKSGSGYTWWNITFDNGLKGWMVEDYLQKLSSVSCTPLAAQTQAISCPTGQTGSITQTRTSSCAAGASVPTWSDWIATANTCTPAAPGPVNGVYSVKDYGAKADGATDDSTAIQNAINAATPDGSGIAQVYIPCGTYIVNKAITAKSNMHIYGDGSCSLLKATASMQNYAPFNASVGIANLDQNGYRARFILTNADYVAGNSNITVDHLSFDFSAQATTDGTHNIHFRNVSNVQIHDVTTSYGNDGIAFTHSNNFSVKNSIVLHHNNAGLDSWDGDSNYTYANNTVDSSGVTDGGYGILITGLSTSGTSATTHDVHITGNTIKNVVSGGIWIQGGYNPGNSQTGLVQNFDVSGNTIDGVRDYYGIRMSESSTGTVTQNTIKNTGRSGIVTIGEQVLAATDVTISNNSISNTNTVSDPYENAALFFGNTSKRITVTGNTVSGTYKYAAQIEAGASSITISGNTFAQGTLGKTLDGGSGDTVQDVSSPVATGPRIGVYYFGMFGPHAWEGAFPLGISGPLGTYYGQAGIAPNMFWWDGVRDLYNHNFTPALQSQIDILKANPAKADYFNASFNWLEPAIGYYDESDPKTLERHINQATSNGISYFSFYWYWDFVLDREVGNDGIDSFLAARNSTDIDFSIDICESGYQGALGQNEFQKVADLLTTKYLSRSNYLKTADGKLIVKVCDGHGIRQSVDVNHGQAYPSYDMAAFGSFISTLRADAKSKLGKDLEILVYIDGTSENDITALRTNHIVDGGTCLNPLPSYPNLPSSAQENSTQSIAWMDARSSGWDFSPCVGERYDNRPRLGIMTGPSDMFRYSVDATPQSFNTTLTQAKAWMDSHASSDPMSQYLTIYAWNEWHEGGILEPNVRDGAAFINQIPAVFNVPFKNLVCRFTGLCPDAGGVVPPQPPTPQYPTTPVQNSNLPVQATNPSPAANATNISRPVTLSWTGSSNTQVYGISVSTSPNFQPETYDATFSGTSYTYQNLQPDTLYYWRIGSWNNYGTTYSPVWSFKTSTAANQSAVCNASGTQVTLTWTPIGGASQYPLRIDDTSNNTGCADHTNPVDGWYCASPSNGDSYSNTGTSPYTASITPGHPYSWWIETSSGTMRNSFTCGTTAISKDPGSNLANAVAALQAALKALLGK